ncbi:hypothetical protein L1887_61022 [Cichorium endivia]|nr:hypothetical protein L1887_61022 [Cichorium endivia]
MHLLDKRSTRALPVAAMIMITRRIARPSCRRRIIQISSAPINFDVKKLVVGLWVGSAGPPSGVHRLLVPSVGDALLALTGRGSADVAFRTPLAPYEKSKFLGSGGSMVARLKLKGIDGRAPPGVEPAA